MKLTATKRAIGVQKLENAYKHVARMGYSVHMGAALDVLMEAERLLRNGFKAWDHAEWTRQIETHFRLYPEARG